MKFFSLLMKCLVVLGLFNFVISGWDEIDNKLYDDEENTDPGVAIDIVYELASTKPTVVLRHRRHERFSPYYSL
ncbi:unnamed protein product [Caenorhabditis brenneri]